MVTARGKLRHVGTNEILLDKVVWCDSFGGKFLGLMFRKSLQDGEGLLMVEAFASRINTSIHMLFMNFPIAVVWLDKEFRVVDTVIAKPWRLAYVPAKPAVFTLETLPEMTRRISVGDQLAFER